ncbi:MAG: thermonuclease family protein [Ignavibacteriae bacterium]|nr:thermonuclease family protein [Ignavibacteriota bacterium]
MKIKLFNLSLLIVVFVFTQLSFAQKQSDSIFLIQEDEITKVVDGDTFKFKHLDKSTRLLCIDTEETYKGKNAREKTEAIADKWLEYYNEQKLEKKSGHPIKLDSPFGYEAGIWAQDFFKHVNRIRIERDDSLRSVDLYGRYLVYVFAEKNGKFVNYALECVRLGYSPYFNKYGNSNRFHKEFVEAQEYAKANKLGIWNPNTKCYPDYDERIKWWNERAEQLENYYSKYSKDKSVVNLLNSDAEINLKNNVGKEATVFCNIGEIFSDRFPYLMRVAISKEVSFDIVVEEEYLPVFESIDTKRMDSYYFYCTGKLENREKKFKMKLKSKDQIKFE